MSFRLQSSIEIGSLGGGGGGLIVMGRSSI